MSNLLDDLYVVSELVDGENLGDESFEGFFTRFFNWDPVRLRSSWKRLNQPHRKFTPAMGSRVEVELNGEMDDYTFDLATRGNKVVTDLASEVLFDVSLILEASEILENNILGLMTNPEGHELVPMSLFNRPLLGARSITPTENEMDLIAQGNEIKISTSDHSGISFNHKGGLTYNTSQTQQIDRTSDERALRKAGTYWDTRKTQDVVKALRTLEPIVSRGSLIKKHMVSAKSPIAKRQLRLLMIWQEILYEHAYFLVHRTSKFLKAV